MKNKKDNDKIAMFLMAFLVSMFWLYVNSAPGIVISRLDQIYLLFGFILPYIIIAGMIIKDKGVKNVYATSGRNGSATKIKTDSS